jgi:hypothetical protein
MAGLASKMYRRAQIPPEATYSVSTLKIDLKLLRINKRKFPALFPIAQRHSVQLYIRHSTVLQCLLDMATGYGLMMSLIHALFCCLHN